MTRICWPFSWAHVASSDLGRLVLNKPETNPNPNCLVSPGTLFGPCWANVGSQGWNAWLFQFRLEAPNQSPCPSLDTWTRPPMCPSNMEGPTYRYGMASKSDKTDISGQHHSTVFFAWSLESGKCRRGSISRWFKYLVQSRPAFSAELWHQSVSMSLEVEKEFMSMNFRSLVVVKRGSKEAAGLPD